MLRSSSPMTRSAGGALRVCLVSEEFPPETGWGGIGTYTYNLAHGLTSLGHRVHVIARTWQPEHVDASAGFLLHRLAVPEPTWRRGTYWANTHFAETRDLLLWSRRVSRCIEGIAATEGVDVVESPEFRAQGLLTTFQRRHAPVVVKLHTPSYVCRRLNGVGAGSSALDTRVSEHLEYRLLRRAAFIISPSRTLLDDVLSEWRLRRDRVQVVANPIDEDFFSTSRHVPKERTSVLYVGRLERRKGVETLIAALPVIERVSGAGWHLKLVGADHTSGPGGVSMKSHLEKLIAAAAVHHGAVEFIGAVPRERLPDLYRAAAVCVVPSLYENFPYTALEAMACGCAVIASDVGGLPEIVQHEKDGVLVPPGDAEALGRAIGGLLNAPELVARLGGAARESVQGRFSRYAIARLTASVYAAVARRGRHPATASADACA